MTNRESNTRATPSARRERQSTAGAPKLALGLGKHGARGSQPQDMLGDDLSDESGKVVMIGIGGGISLPFKHFHAAQLARHSSVRNQGNRPVPV